ncbi:MAG: hypothetical protein ACOYMW_01115 [Candidatus Competibacteraceae bacterium]
MIPSPSGYSLLSPLLLTAAIGLLLLCHALWGWVPILDSANLAFHEAGHPIFGLLFSRLAVYGGTLMQLLIPAACAWECYRREQRYGFYVCLAWIAENLLNIARYMADARAHELPLVGGVDPAAFHDWTEILNRWGLLNQDTALAVLVRIGAMVLMVWIVKQAWTTACHWKLGCDI